jgi:hypothetical protein
MQFFALHARSFIGESPGLGLTSFESLAGIALFYPGGIRSECSI